MNDLHKKNWTRKPLSKCGDFICAYNNSNRNPNLFSRQIVTL